MNALAWSSAPPMKCDAPDLDHERRFQPVREAVDAFLRATGPYTEARVYEPGLPHAFTRTTYFDTPALDLLASASSGYAQRLRLREYAAAMDLGQPPSLTGRRFLEVKVTSGERRTKSRCALSAHEAEALLYGLPLPEGSAAVGLMQQLARGPVMPWVTAWYRRVTRTTADERVRITLDQDLAFALPPLPGDPAEPTCPLERASAALLEVKWQDRAPAWLEQALRPLASSETQGSKFEQGMRVLLGGALPPRDD
ncbi:VTC domain-containing protein [Pyxidicoccus caerfyrddinensis]|uniref:VTC domain-containing protein n=1 Tax=Pyxidicoccus caerfyrddinensis TaxID=2709663 RepID=UPI0013DB1297|nr:VTC domain-containing protein [Pyxidicoccus caerfyrddinensis]